MRQSQDLSEEQKDGWMNISYTLIDIATWSVLMPKPLSERQKDGWTPSWITRMHTISFTLLILLHEVY